jgi:hypothetical protein
LVGVLFTFSEFSVVSVGQWFRQFSLRLAAYFFVSKKVAQKTARRSQKFGDFIVSSLKIQNSPRRGGAQTVEFS